MRCDGCKHFSAVKAALEACHGCDCAHIHGQVLVQPDATDWAVARRVETVHAPQTGVTALPPDAEDALRRLLSDLTMLDPVELLLVQHIARGGTYADFRETLGGIVRRFDGKAALLDGRKGGFRQLAHSWAKRVIERIPALGPFFEARIAERWTRK